MRLPLVLIFSWFIIPHSNWDQKDYESYNVSRFFDREDVNQRINLKSVDRELMEAAIFFATNEIRLENNKRIFRFHPILWQSSRLHSEAMAMHNFFDHQNRRNKKLRTTSDRINQAGGGFRGYAENIADINIYKLGKKGTYFVNHHGEKVNKQGKPLQTRTYKELAQEVVNRWMHSTGHRRNIMASNTYLGCGISEVAYSNDGIPRLLITQNFGEK